MIKLISNFDYNNNDVWKLFNTLTINEISSLFY